MKRFGLICLLSFPLALLPVTSVAAEDPPKTDMQLRVEAIKAKQLELEAELSLKKAEDALRRYANEAAAPTKEPALSSGVSKGDIDLVIPASIQAHRACTILAQKLANELLGKQKGKAETGKPMIPLSSSVLVCAGIDPFDNDMVADQISVLLNNLNDINNDAAKFTSTAHAAALANISSLTQGVRNTVANIGSLFELFKVKTTFSNVETPISNEYYVTAVYQALHQSFNLSLMTNTLLPPTPKESNEAVVALFKNLALARKNINAVDEKIDSLNDALAKVKAQIVTERAQSHPDSVKLERFEKQESIINKSLKHGADLKENLPDVVAVTDAFIKEYFTASDGKRPVGFALLRQSAAVAEVQAKGGYYLRLVPGPAGGVNRTIESLFNSGSLSHAGGAIVTYYLYNSSGKLLSTSSFMGITPFARMGDGDSELDELQGDDSVESGDN